MCNNFIYKITNLVNGKCYIGQTSRGKARWQEHLSELRKGEHHSHSLQNAYNKYGKENFSFEIVEYTLKDYLNMKEIYWIDYFDSYYNGYNETLGGETNPLDDPIIRERHKSIMKEAMNRPEVKAKVSAGLKKVMKEVCNRPEFKSKMSEAQKKRYSDPNEHIKSSEASKKAWSDPKVRAKALQSIKKRWSDPKVRAQQSVAQKKRFEDPKERAKFSKKVYQYTLDYILVRTYESVESCKEFKFDITSVRESCYNKYCGDLCIYKKYIWSFKPLTKEQVLKIVSEYKERKKVMSAKRSESNKKRWSDLKVRAEQSTLMKEVNKRSEVRDKRSKKVYQYTLDLKLVRTYTSRKECKEYEFSPDAVGDACRNKYYKTGNIYKGFIWSDIPLTTNEEEAEKIS